MIKANDIHFSYNKKDSWIFNINIQKGEKVALLGKSGVGKSTLLRIIAGLLRYQKGSLYLNGSLSDNLKPSERPISILFQKDNLFNHLNVLDNIKIGLSPNLKVNSLMNHKLMVLSEQMEIIHLFSKFPEELSGGQAQRVALCRVFLREKPILLLDEPFNGLDDKLKFDILRLLDSLCKSLNITLFMITHDKEEAVFLNSRVIELT